MVAQLAGVASGGVAQSRGDGVGSGSNRHKPSQRSMTPGLTGPLRAEGFPVSDLNAIGETPERRLWVYKREARRAVFARRSVLTVVGSGPAQFLSLAVRTACHNSGAGRSKKPSMQSLLPTRL